MRARLTISHKWIDIAINVKIADTPSIWEMAYIAWGRGWRGGGGGIW